MAISIFLQMKLSILENMFFFAFMIPLTECPFVFISRFQGELFYKQHMYKRQDKMQNEILNSLPQGVVILDSQGEKVKFANAPFF
jgi:c-di-AMP phosphodiesterase-like protein